MTPAEHYEQAEVYIAEAHVKMANGIVDPLDQQAIDYLLRQAQVHATLATVNPGVLWPKTWLIEKPQEAILEFDEADGRCSCPRLAAVPIARLSTDPACPIHGDPG